MRTKHNKAGLANIRHFMNQQNMGIIGVSRKKSKFGNTIFKELKAKGYDLYPVHPEMETFEQETCVKNIDLLPDDVSTLIICTKPAQVPDLVKQAIKKGISNIWLQQGASNDEAIEYAKSHNINIIHKQCVLMFAEPVQSIHSFHRSINKFFGVYPK
jgi:hypothetical protein